MCVLVWVYVCIGVRERERERDKMGEREKERERERESGVEGWKERGTRTTERTCRPATLGDEYLWRRRRRKRRRRRRRKAGKQEVRKSGRKEVRTRTGTLSSCFPVCAVRKLDIESLPCESLML